MYLTIHILDTWFRFCIKQFGTWILINFRNNLSAWICKAYVLFRAIRCRLYTWSFSSQTLMKVTYHVFYTLNTKHYVQFYRLRTVVPRSNTSVVFGKKAIQQSGFRVDVLVTKWIAWNIHPFSCHCKLIEIYNRGNMNSRIHIQTYLTCEKIFSYMFIGRV